MTRIGWLLLCMVIACRVGYAQVNGYATVTAISGTTFTVANVDETYDTFESGEDIIIMQMQDDVIGSNTGDNANFGKLSSIASAGLYEVATISSVTESGGTPTSITISSSSSNTYNTGTNSRVQLITYPQLGGGSDYTTTADISAVTWDGDVGGVVAFHVDGILTLDHNISVAGQGFRGGASNTGASTSCDTTTYRTASQIYYADKGEGIYRSTNSNYAAGRAPILTGGGGGSTHNGGGGGGGNYSSGGNGGPGWTCTAQTGGTGGIALDSEIWVARIFMGGGGGSGEINNAGPGTGQDGGGIILIEAEVMKTSGSCGGRTISANGIDAVASTQDGAGGGGAGGSIVLKVDSFDVVAGCPLTVSASGGNGGDVNHSAAHGGGGGGGQGVVYYSIAQPTVNITSDTDPGSGGDNNSGGSAGTASTGSGNTGAEEGVFDAGDTATNGTGSNPLPIELLYFNAHSYNQGVDLKWSTATEINNMGFTVERSADGVIWEEINRQSGAGNSSFRLDYDFWDDAPLSGRSYYRLRQTDFNGEFSLSDVATIYRSEAQSANIAVYPNPGDRIVNVTHPLFEASDYKLTIQQITGQQIDISHAVQKNAGQVQVDVSSLKNGIYFLVLESGDQRIVHKLVVRH